MQSQSKTAVYAYDKGTWKEPRESKLKKKLCTCVKKYMRSLTTSTYRVKVPTHLSIVGYVVCCWLQCAMLVLLTRSEVTRTKPRPSRSPSTANVLYNALLTIFGGGFRGGQAGSASSTPLGDRLTQALTVLLANAKCWSSYCKTWYSEYSKWLPPVAFLTVLECTKFVFGQGSPRTPLWKL